eukprot:4223612-Pyramimonas_sp.AAC.1
MTELKSCPPPSSSSLSSPYPRSFSFSFSFFSLKIVSILSKLSSTIESSLCHRLYLPECRRVEKLVSSPSSDGQLASVRWSARLHPTVNDFATRVASFVRLHGC